jgi:predicted amidohydrolase YtcJ
MTATPKRVLLRGGRVYTPASPVATALLTVGGAVAWIGGDEAAASYGDSCDVVVDLAGSLVTPGFVDAHVHLGQTGFALQSLDLAFATSVREALEALRMFAGTHVGGVLFAYGWDESRWADGRVFTMAELDRAVGDRVAYVSRVDSHSGVISSALLAHDRSIADRDGWLGDGLVARDAHHAARTVTHGLWTAADRESALRAALAGAASAGITSLHELNAPHIAPFSDFAVLRSIAAETAAPEVVPYWGAFEGADVDDPATEGLLGYAGDLCVDGAIGSRTACMHEPYADANTSGHLYLDRRQVADHVVFCTDRGVQAGFHVIGDRAMTETVAGFEAAAVRVGVDAVVRARHRIEHVEMPTPAEVEAMARLGIVASVQPSFDTAWGSPGELYERRLGHERAWAMNPFGAMVRAGVVLAFGSDSPVTPLDPWAGLRAAAFHHDEAQRLTVATAFDAHTRGGHRARRDDSGGVLVPGAPASYAVWATEPPVARSVLPDLHPETPLPSCLRTVVAGARAFDADRLDETPLAAKGTR